MADITNNALVITIVGGLAVAAVVGLWKFIFSKNNDVEKTQTNIKNEVTNAPQVTINNNITDHSKQTSQEQIDFKARTKILFVEDQTFKQVKNLKKAGWRVSQINDVTSLDMPEVHDAHVIFVDYKGVGKLSGDQGKGLVKQLKNQYGSSKWIIFYSSHPFTLDVHDIGADSFLSKESDFYEIERKVIEGARHIFQ